MYRQPIRIAIIFLSAFLLFPGTGKCDVQGIEHFLHDAMKTLELEKNSPDLGVLTNANYVRLNEKTTEQYVDIIAQTTGCSIGKGNLLFFDERPHNSLLVAMANKKTGQCVVLRYDGKFGKLGALSMQEKDIEKSDFFFRNSGGVTGEETYHITSIMRAWLGDAPYDLLKSAETHGHICPGIILGYLTAKGIEQKFPLQHPDEEYIFIASPNGCKDDAIMTLLGLTAGKKSLYSMAQDPKSLIHNTDNYLMGILIKWSNKENTGMGAVVALSLEALFMVAKLDITMPRNLKIMTTQKFFDWLNDSSLFFRVEKAFPVSREFKKQLIAADQSPYDLLGMVSKQTIQELSNN